MSRSRTPRSRERRYSCQRALVSSVLAIATEYAAFAQILAR
jgi:hypothetical protein